MSALLAAADALTAAGEALRQLAAEQAPKPAPKAIPAKVAAERLGVTPKTVYQLIRDGKLGALRVGPRGRRVDLASLEQFEKMRRI